MTNWTTTPPTEPFAWCPTCKKFRNCWWTIFTTKDGKCSECETQCESAGTRQ